MNIPTKTSVRFTLTVFFISAAFLAGVTRLNAGAIEFYQYPGVETCTGNEAAAPPLQVGFVGFSGGRVRRSLLAGGTVAAYAADSSCGGDQQGITITFKGPLANVTLDLWDGHKFGPYAYVYTIRDDQGHSLTVPFYGASNYDSLNTVELPWSNVRELLITPGPFPGTCPTCDPGTGKPEWGFAVEGLRFTSYVSTVDPVPDLLDKDGRNGISLNPAKLIEGKIATTIAADGAARLVVQVQANYAGERMTLTLLNDVGQTSSSIEEDGTLGAVDGPPNPTAMPVTVTPIDTDSGPTAFAIYYAPPDYARPTRGDDRYSFFRVVSITINSPDAPGYGNFLSLTIVRPPVFLIHGLWGAPGNWETFVPLLQDPRIITYRADYSNSLCLNGPISNRAAD